MYHSFEQNSEYSLPYAPVPLVAENIFLKKEPDSQPLPKFEQSKALLPKPIWEGHPQEIEAYWKAWEIAFRNLRKPEPGSGFVSDFIDTAFNDCLFMWDSAFILMFGKYGSRAFHFQGTLDNLYSHQHRDGYICREIDTHNGTDQFTRFDPCATGPEVLPWCEWEYFQTNGDRERLEAVFPPLMAYHRWMREHHTWPDGSYFSSGLGCGMDNVPRTEPGYHHRFSHGHMVWVDACMQACFSCDILMRMATELGRTEFLEELASEKENLEHIINERLWDPETGFYYDQWKNGQWNMVRHVGAFWALLSGCASQEQAQHLVKHLDDKTEFKTANRIPSLSKDHPLFAPTGKYWQGGVWPPINYMVMLGLDRYGYHCLAHEIAKDFMRAVWGVYAQTGTFFETYAPEYIEGKPASGDFAEADFVGWSGLGPIAILFEHIFGIKPDVKTNSILWDVRLMERHGIQDYVFGKDGLIDLSCEARSGSEEEPRITVKSNVAFTLEILWGCEEQRQKKALFIKPTDIF